MSSSLEELKRTEIEIDGAIAAMPLLAAPVRVPLYGIFSVLHTLFPWQPYHRYRNRELKLAIVWQRGSPSLNSLGWARCPGNAWWSECARDAANAYLEIDPDGQAGSRACSRTLISHRSCRKFTEAITMYPASAADGFKLQFPITGIRPIRN